MQDEYLWVNWKYLELQRSKLVDSSCYGKVRELSIIFMKKAKEKSVIFTILSSNENLAYTHLKNILNAQNQVC